MPDPMRDGKGTRNGTKKPFVWKKNGGLFTLCSYSDVDATRLRLSIDAVSKAGGSLMFGITQDRGAFAVCLLLNDQKVKEYPHNVDELYELLDALVDEMTGQ